MKKITILSTNGRILYTGTKNDVKDFVKTNRLKRGTYSFKENYVEKVIIPAPDFDKEENFLAKAETKEGIFNRIF